MRNKNWLRKHFHSEPHLRRHPPSAASWDAGSAASRAARCPTSAFPPLWESESDRSPARCGRWSCPPMRHGAATKASPSFGGRSACREGGIR
eukprot:scaffold3068_cov269-Pinguiococcus_pyrenoidosus.AAC.14